MLKQKKSVSEQDEIVIYPNQPSSQQPVDDYQTAKNIYEEMISPEPLEEKDSSFICLLNEFGHNSVLDMIDIKGIHILLPFIHENISNVNKHWKVTNDYQFKRKLYDLFKSTFEHKTNDNKKLNLYFQGLNVAESGRLFGFGKFHSMLKEICDYFADDNMSEIPLSSQHFFKFMINYKAKPIQLHILSFIGSISPRLMNIAAEHGTVILEIKVPSNKQFISNKTSKNKPISDNSSKIKPKQNNKSIEEELMDLSNKFVPFSQNNACYKIDIDCIDFENDNMYKPENITQTKAKTLHRNNNVPLINIMKIKQLFLQKNTDDPDHKIIRMVIFKIKTKLKYYLYYEGAIIRLQIDDICTWFRYLFVDRNNELDQIHWNKIIKPYFDNILNQQQIISNDDEKYDMPPNRMNNWGEIDIEFYLKHLSFINQLCQWDAMKSFHNTLQNMYHNPNIKAISNIIPFESDDLLIFCKKRNVNIKDIEYFFDHNTMDITTKTDFATALQKSCNIQETVANDLWNIFKFTDYVKCELSDKVEVLLEESVNRLNANQNKYCMLDLNFMKRIFLQNDIDCIYFENSNNREKLIKLLQKYDIQTVVANELWLDFGGILPQTFDYTQKENDETDLDFHNL